MPNKCDIYTDHYALQWLKPMRIGPALLHCWLAALEEFDFTVHQWPRKSQTQVDGLGRLPVEQASLEEEEEAALVA